MMQTVLCNNQQKRSISGNGISSITASEGKRASDYNNRKSSLPVNGVVWKAAASMDSQRPSLQSTPNSLRQQNSLSPSSQLKSNSQPSPVTTESILEPSSIVLNIIPDIEISAI